MRTLNFPQKEIEPLTEKYVEVINNFKNTGSDKNGLVNAIVRAYNNHNILTISPDDVMNNICCVWAKYLILNAEKFRDQVVKHEGKKTLTILTEQNTVWNNALLLDHMDRYTGLINQEQDSIKWMDVKFTTTSDLDNMIRKVAMLASQKEYYAYHSRTMCWLPQINLLGTIEDWELLYDKVQEMPTFDDKQSNWKKLLLKVLAKFIVANDKDIDFWQAPLTYSPGGSGSIPYYCGWITVFNPFDEKGVWGRTSRPKGFGRYDIEPETNYLYVPVEDVMNLTVDFEIVCEDDFGKQHGTLKVYAGPTAISASIENGISPQNKLYFTYVAKK